MLTEMLGPVRDLRWWRVRRVRRRDVFRDLWRIHPRQILTCLGHDTAFSDKSHELDAEVPTLCSTPWGRGRIDIVVETKIAQLIE